MATSKNGLSCFLNSQRLYIVLKWHTRLENKRFWLVRRKADVGNNSVSRRDAFVTTVCVSLPLTWMNDIIRRAETLPPTRNYQINRRCSSSPPQFHQLSTLTMIPLVKGSRLCNRSHHTLPVISRCVESTLVKENEKTWQKNKKRQFCDSSPKIAKSFKPAILKDGDSFNGFNSRQACVIHVRESDRRLVGREATNGRVADRLYGLTSHHQGFMMGHFGAKAAPLLCLLLGF